jgi:hypothetical protein
MADYRFVGVIIGFMAITAIIIGAVIQNSIDNIVLKDVNAEIINIESHGAMDDNHYYTEYIYTVNITNKIICDLDPTSVKYDLYQIITNVYLYKDGSCAENCRRIDCVDYLGIILLVIGCVLFAIVAFCLLKSYIADKCDCDCCDIKYSIQS